jgi:hypothetical protein
MIALPLFVSFLVIFASSGTVTCDNAFNESAGTNLFAIEYCLGLAGSYTASTNGE